MHENISQEEFQDVEKTTAKILHQISLLQDYIKKNPTEYTALYRIAKRYYVLEEYSSAGKACMDLAKLGAEQAEVYDLGARAFIKGGKFPDAIKIIRMGLQKFPLKYEFLLQLATALHKNMDFDEAEKVFKQAGEENIDHPASYIAISNFYNEQGRLAEALDILEQGLEKFPDSTIILNNIGAAYTRIEQHLKASEHYLKALRIEPENVSCLLNLGTSFERMKNTVVAQQFYDEALKLDPENPIGLCCKANLLCNNGMAQEAVPIYKKGLSLLRDRPLHSNIYMIHYSNLVFFQHYLPDLSRREIYDEILNWQKELCSDCIEKPATDFNNDADKNRPLKIGLVSKGFCVHPVGQMIYAALENLNKESYELYCYSELAPEKKDYLTEKFFELIPKTISINNKVNRHVVETIRGDEIDVLIEMTGHSEGGRRLQMVAERAAPVQVKWVGGLFNTTGIPQMDWLLTDNIETPKGEDKWYTEKLYRMPDDYIVYYPPYYAPKVSESPAKKNGFITFGNLNNLAKTNSYSIELWSKILHMVPGSKLLLKGNKMDTPFVVEHLQKSFEAHGIGIDRLLIEGGESHQKFLNVYNRIDIALDPHPYTGGLTTCEALWMGVPVVTLPGETFAGRHAASHLTNAGLPEWIAKDERDYIDIAVKWASDLEALSELRAGLRDHVAKTPLVDGPRFARNLEIALRHMWSDWCDRKITADKPAKVTKPKPKKSKKRK